MVTGPCELYARQKMEEGGKSQKKKAEKQKEEGGERTGKGRAGATKSVRGLRNSDQRKP
jgi:hypothetical protein